MYRSCIFKYIVRKYLDGCVKNPNPKAFFIFFLFLHVLCMINYWEQRLCAALAMVKKKPHPHLSTRRQGKRHQPKSLWSETNRAPATQNRKSSPDRRGETRKSNKYRGRNHQENPCRRHQLQQNKINCYKHYETQSNRQ